MRSGAETKLQQDAEVLKLGGQLARAQAYRKVRLLKDGVERCSEVAKTLVRLSMGTMESKT